ncbi:MAG: 3-isopropylmalate dehydratase small subunit, partial [Candidatus Thiodiazotropha sp.]
FRVIIAPSYADIFFNNSFKNGLLPIVLEEKIVDELFHLSGGEEALALTVDLQAQSLSVPAGQTWNFEVDPFRKHCLINGLDDIGLTLQHVDEIKAYEARRREQAPWLFS